MTTETSSEPTKPLDGRAALVTGGSRGIGRAIVERLARDGGRIINISTFDTVRPALGMVVLAIAPLLPGRASAAAGAEPEPGPAVLEGAPR